MSSVPIRSIQTAAATAQILDQGALALAWAPSGAAPALFSYSALDVVPGVSPHAGVPVCWPWFGPGRRAGISPAHGFVRAAEWEFVDERTSPDGASVTVRHRINQAEATSSHWPYPYSLELVSTFGAELTQSLTTTNTGTEPFDYEEALHAYLVVGDVRQIQIEGLSGCSYYDKLSLSTHEQFGPLRFSGETDTVYYSTTAVQVIDPVLQRRLTMTTKGASGRVVWNPGEVKGPGISDVLDEWSRFVCVEPCNVLGEAIRLEPGQSHTLEYKLTVAAL